MSLFSLSAKQVKKQLSESDDPLAELQKMKIPLMVLKEVFSETEDQRSIHLCTNGCYQFHIYQKNDGDVMIRLSNAKLINAFEEDVIWRKKHLAQYQKNAGDEKTFWKVRFTSNPFLQHLNNHDWDVLSEFCVYLAMCNEKSRKFSIRLVSHHLRKVSLWDDETKTYQIPHLVPDFNCIDIETLLNFFNVFIQ